MNTKIKKQEQLQKEYTEKQEKLRHYAGKDLMEFAQLDGFANALGDSVFHPDKDGDALFGGCTKECMSGVWQVRILITKGTDKITALRLIKKLERWLKREKSEDITNGCVIENEVK